MTDRDDMIIMLLEEIRRDSAQMKEDLACVKQDTAVNTASLKEHMRRTEAAEKSIDLLRIAQETCPARKESEGKKYVMKEVRDWAVFVGLIIAIITFIVGS